MAGNTKKDIVASVLIPTYNGEEYLGLLLERVFSQKTTFKYEVIIIDSGSKDSTLEIIKKFPKVELHTIPNSEFGHGKTRNKAASLARGEFVVYLSQDAVPAHDKWLEGMVEPFYVSDKVYCVFGKQIPRPHCDITTKREVNSVFSSLGPDHSLMLHRGHMLNSKNTFPAQLTFFSDVNSAVRRKYLLENIPYRDVRYAEDQLLGKDVLEAGYLKVYTPYGSVEHSNEYSVKDAFYRKYDEYSAMYDVLGVKPPSSAKSFIAGTVRGTLKDVKACIKDPDYSFTEKIFNMITCPLRNMQRERAAFLVGSDKKRKNLGKKYSLEERRK